MDQAPDRVRNARRARREHWFCRGDPRSYEGSGCRAFERPGGLRHRDCLLYRSERHAEYPNALCPAGTVVIGGGGSSNSTSTLVAIGSSHPQHPGNDWEMGFDNNSASDSAGTVYAICANKPKGYRIVHTIQDNPSGQLTSVVATCPRGRKGLGGGGYMGGPATTITLHDSYPSGSKQWVIHMGNGSAGDEKLVYSFEVCGEKVKGLVKVEGSPTSNPAGSQSGANVFCPGAEVPIGGGAQASSSAISVDMNSSYPISNGWHVDENNRSGSAESFTPWVVCAGT